MATKLYNLISEKIGSSSILHKKNNKYYNLESLLNPIVLYDNSSGTNGNVSLNESSANFESIRIFYRSNDNYYASIDVYQPNGKKISLFSIFVQSDTRVYAKASNFAISGNKINKEKTNECRLDKAATPGVYTANNLYITRVIGFK